MPMSLLTPKALWLALLLVPLIVLYILKVRRKRLRIGSTWLWQQAQRDLMARSPFKRLVLQLPLILQALALLALVVAAAMPASTGTDLVGDHVAIIIDTSASMSGVDPASQKTRIALAQQAASKLIDSLSPGSDAMILDAGRDARIALPSDRDRRRMKSAIEALKARDEEGNLAAAIGLAASRLQQAGGRTKIVVLTDGNLARPAPLASKAIDIELVAVGGPIDNTAVVRVDVRTGNDPLVERTQVQAFVSLANYGSAPQERYITMRKQGDTAVLASRKVLIDPGATLPVVMTFHPEEADFGQGLIFELAPHDALRVDDMAYGRIPAGRQLPTYLAAAGEPSPWLLRALVSDKDAQVRKSSVEELMAADVPADAFVVLDGACPRGAPGGELLVVNPPSGDCYETKVGDSADKPLITSWEETDSRMRFLTLDGVYMSSARLLSPQSKRQALITSDKGVIAADSSTPRRSITLLGFDVGESNWPLRASYVLFMRNLMERARRHRSRSAGISAKAGMPLRVPVPAAVKQIEVTGPGEVKATHEVREGLAIVPHVAQAGLYRINWTAPREGGLWVPVNLTSAAESDLRKKPVDATDPSVELPVRKEPVEGHDRHSWLLALLALGLIVFDVWWLTRRPGLPAGRRRPIAPRREA